MQLNGQTALITGGGSGLGEATARLLASRGVRVAVLDRDADRAARVAADIDGTALSADVADESSVAAAFGSFQETFGSAPRIVVNCAGIGLAARIVNRDGDLAIDVFEKTLRVNLVGTYVVLSHAARGMQSLAPLDDGERGVIVNTASVAWQDGQIGQCAYAASKGGIASLSLPAARELARVGVRVMAIAPGLFETAMTETLPDETRAAIAANIPFPSRLGMASEFAQAVEMIATNTYLNGTTLRLDGAVRLPPR